jgi:hypothetical protein
LSIEASHPESRGNVNDIGSNVQSIGSLHEDEIPTHFHHPPLERAIDPNRLLKTLHDFLAKKPIIMRQNPMLQPWLPKPSGQIAFPPPLVVVGAGGDSVAATVVGAVGAIGAVSAVGNSGAADHVKDLDPDNSDNEEGVIGGNILAALLMDRVVYMAGEFITAFIQRLHLNPFQILRM